MRQVVLDTETTGLNVERGHRVIEIGCVELLERRLSGRRLHFFLNPDRQSDEGALAVHGISDESLRDRLDAIIRARRKEIDALVVSYGVPKAPE